MMRPSPRRPVCEGLFFAPALMLMILCCSAVSRPALAAATIKETTDADVLPLITVSSPAGTVRGVVASPDPSEVPGVASAHSVAVFKGIPYAAPPVGDLRWEPPQRHPGWNGVKDALDFGPSCLASTIMFRAPDRVLAEDEDCLTLNVWAPLDSEGNVRSGLPVVVYIHGGGFMVGSSSNSLVAPDPLNYTLHHDTVYVSMNYRLGVMGFMAHAGMSTAGGLFGIQDQKRAFQWVQENIAAFGGDPTRVTSQGNSAGAISLCLLTLMEGSDQLFSRAILQSPSCGGPFYDLDTARADSLKFAKAAGCGHVADPADQLRCLRNKPGESIQYALEARRGLMYFEGHLWFPVINGEDLPLHPAEIAAQRREKEINIDVVVGTNTEEGSLLLFFAFPLYFKQSYLSAHLDDVFGKEANQALLDFYTDPATGEARGYDVSNDFAVAVRVLSDMWTCSQFYFNSILQHAVRSLHAYEFAHRPTWFSWPMDQLGVTHGAEMSFVYGRTDPMGDVDRRVSSHVMRLWRRIIHGLDLVKSSDDSKSGWPVFVPEPLNGDDASVDPKQYADDVGDLTAPSSSPSRPGGFDSDPQAASASGAWRVLRLNEDHPAPHTPPDEMCRPWKPLVGSGVLQRLPYAKEPMMSKIMNVYVFKALKLLFSRTGMAVAGSVLVALALLILRCFWKCCCRRKSLFNFGSTDSDSSKKSKDD